MIIGGREVLEFSAQDKNPSPQRNLQQVRRERVQQRAYHNPYVHPEAGARAAEPSLVPDEVDRRAQRQRMNHDRGYDDERANHQRNEDCRAMNLHRATAIKRAIQTSRGQPLPCMQGLMHESANGFISRLSGSPWLSFDFCQLMFRLRFRFRSALTSWQPRSSFTPELSPSRAAARLRKRLSKTATKRISEDGGRTGRMKFFAAVQAFKSR